MKKKICCRAPKCLRAGSSIFMAAFPKRIRWLKSLANRFLRSGTSVGANYREANRARSKAEFISKMGDCLKEADETLYWLELLLDEKIVPAKKLSALVSESGELVAIFITILKKARGHE
jgi:four helix bundle protein